MKKIFKQTAAMLLAATLCMGNNGLVQSPLTDNIKGQVSNEAAFRAKAATKKTSTTNAKAKSKKQKEIAAYNKKAKKAYKQFLKDIFVYGKKINGVAFSKNSTKEYAITDLNNDGKLELLLNTNPIHGNGPGCIIYTFYKGKVKEAGSTYASGINYHGFKKGNLIYNCVIRDEHWDTFSILKNGKLVTVASYYDDDLWGGTTKYYVIKGKKVTKKKFSAFLKKSIGCKSKDDLDKNMKKYQKQYKTTTYKMPTVKTVSGVKVKHQFRYKKDKASSEFDGYDQYNLYDDCKISWSKSVKGDVKIVYSTDRKFKDEIYTESKKISDKQNYCILKDLYGGEKYYIKLRATMYNGRVKSDYTKIYTFQPKSYGSRAIKEGNNFYYACHQNGKDYIGKTNIKTKKETKIMNKQGVCKVFGLRKHYLYYSKWNKKKYREEVYVYNRSNKKHKLLLECISVDAGWEMLDAGGLFVTDTKIYGKNLFDDQGRLYSFDLDGSNKKKIAENMGNGFVYKNHMYWYEIKGDIYGEKFNARLVMYNAKTKKVIAITEWFEVKELELNEYTYDFSREYAIKHVL